MAHMECTVSWTGAAGTRSGMGFVAETGSGHVIAMDGAPDAARPEFGGQNLAPRPMETLLAGTGGCTAYDVVLILRRGRHDVRGCSVRLSSERVAETPVQWYGAATRVRDEDVERFPGSLDGLPLLLPTAHSPLRARVERWLEQHGLRPRIAGEFEDSALLALFAANGLGVFPVSQLGGADVLATQGLRLLGSSADLREEIHAIRSRRGLHHPLVRRLLGQATR